jgi:antitoxin component of RelBE/YafQ-DinJ toxin-antitoxin module
VTAEEKRDRPEGVRPLFLTDQGGTSYDFTRCFEWHACDFGEREHRLATAVIAGGIGKRDLRYEQFSHDQVQQVLTQMGVPPKGAALYIELYKAINAGALAPLEPRSPENTTPTSFERFLQDVFAPAYHTKAPSA